MLPDFALQPGRSQSFIITLELFEDDVAYENVVVIPEGTPVEPTANALPDTFAGITQAASGEVVMVEWVDETTLRYAIGCHGEVFTEHTWYQYDVASGESVPVEHPAIARINPDLLAVIGLSDPMAYARSFLTFPAPVGQRRIIYQSDINVVSTAELDGSFRRLIWDDLSRVSLQGFIWLPISRFMAYYYGAYGELVRYFTASLEGQRISDSVYEVVPSIIVPGATPDGTQAVIAIEEEGAVGYYLQSTIFEARELLFEGDAPGNNYPAPIYTVDEAESAFVYLIRPVEGRPVLQCFDMQSRTLSDLTVVPLQLDTQHRGWTWLSPDETTMALAANGVDGGLWLIDLEAFGGCTPTLEG
jgi:hypothetical protein